MSTCIYIFTRDLRIKDNLGFIYSLNNYDKVIPIFCLDPIQVSEKNKYRSSNSIYFMIKSINELKKSLKNKLNLFEGDTYKIIEDIKKQFAIKDIIISKDYTPFSKKRSKKLNCLEIDNHRLISKNFKKLDNTVYKVFTPYYNKCKKYKIDKPKSPPKDYLNKLIILNNTLTFLDLPNIEYNSIKPGRKEGLKILSKLEKFNNYHITRDYPIFETTRLSAHHKFGTISIRETYWAIQKKLSGKSKELLTRQLFWRDFYYNISEEYPNIYGNSFLKKYNNIKWSNSEKYFQKWCEGNTGFPIVDAAMKQLNSTGWMHNRLRMIVSSFLTKDLLIDWRWGEKYFAQKLVDYDPAQNNGGWQWGASTGTDSQPYFRIFNPWTQSKKFDKDGKFIKKFLPELKNVESINLHKEGFLSNHETYPSPIINHSEQRKKALDMYKNALK